MIRALLVLLALAGPALAHSWYPPACCSGFDCRPVPLDDVEELPGGAWRYRPLGIVFPASTVRPSRDRNVHVCYQQWDRRPLCIFIVQGA